MPFIWSSQSILSSWWVQTLFLGAEISTMCVSGAWGQLLEGDQQSQEPVCLSGPHPEENRGSESWLLQGLQGLILATQEIVGSVSCYWRGHRSEPATGQTHLHVCICAWGQGVQGQLLKRPNVHGWLLGCVCVCVQVRATAVGLWLQGLHVRAPPTERVGVQGKLLGVCMYKFSTNSLSMQSAPEGSRISPFVLYQLTVAFSVCVNLCGQLCMYVDKSMSVHIHVYMHWKCVCLCLLGVHTQAYYWLDVRRWSCGGLASIGVLDLVTSSRYSTKLWISAPSRQNESLKREGKWRYLIYSQGCLLKKAMKLGQVEGHYWYPEQGICIWEGRSLKN